MQLKKLVQDNGFTSFAFSAKSNVVSTSEFPLPVHVDVTATYNEWSYYFTATIAASCNNKGMMESMCTWLSTKCSRQETASPSS